jgi:hypothetical protein
MMHTQTHRRFAVAAALVLIVALGWLVLAHPFGQGCLRQTGSSGWVLVDAAGQNIPLAGRPPAQPVVC